MAICVNQNPRIYNQLLKNLGFTEKQINDGLRKVSELIQQKEQKVKESEIKKQKQDLNKEIGNSKKNLFYIQNKKTDLEAKREELENKIKKNEEETNKINLDLREIENNYPNINVQQLQETNFAYLDSISYNGTSIRDDSFVQRAANSIGIPQEQSSTIIKICKHLIIKYIKIKENKKILAEVNKINKNLNDLKQREVAQQQELGNLQNSLSDLDIQLAQLNQQQPAPQPTFGE